MFVCKECENIFEYPTIYSESLGPCGEPNSMCKYSGCPACGGAYVETKICDVCGRYIKGQYIRTIGNDFICECCYSEYDIMEDD